MQDKSASLSKKQLHIIRNKGTQYPHSGEYDTLDEPGTYLCRQCGLALFRADAKFHSGCGWPSFDQPILNHVLCLPDKDGLRTEILCRQCQAHLGHVFKGEHHTPLNTRYCVNSLSLDFVPTLEVLNTEEAIVAAGCFWGVEYYFKPFPGVLKTEVGYTGGHLEEPSYEAICTSKTGHVEAIRVVFDSNITSYEKILRYFFEIHDPSQSNGQGPDLGSQYLSCIFCYDEKQSQIAQKLISLLEAKKLNIATKINAVQVFWPAEPYHQNYYQKTNKQPYCHHYTKRF